MKMRIGLTLSLLCGAFGALQSSIHVGLLDDAALDLAREVFGDGLDRGVDAGRVRVVQQHIVAAQRAHVRDAIAHLPRADDPD